jgi:hypothetical protein
MVHFFDRTQSDRYPHGRGHRWRRKDGAPVTRAPKHRRDELLLPNRAVFMAENANLTMHNLVAGAGRR